MKRFLWLGFVLCVYVICTGCGETYRPIIIPNPPVFPNPKATHTVVSINDNGTITPGSAMSVDVAGDADMSVAPVGLAPVHAVQQSAGVVLVVNHSVTGAVADSLTKLNFSTPVIGSTSTISLPANSAPNFVATTESARAYVLLPGTVPPSVAVVSTNSVAETIPLGINAQPVAMAETPNAQKLYVASKGDNTVYGFNTVDRSARTVTGPFNAPLWVVARSDSQRVYVLNGNGDVSTIDITSSAGPDTVIDASINAPGAAYMLYDGNLNRLYIPGGSQLTMLDASPSTPTVLAGGPIAIPTVQPSTRAAGDPCLSTATATLHTIAVTALPDGSRAYVGSYYEDLSDNICPQVTVIDAASNTVKGSPIAVPGFPAYDALCSVTRFRLTMAAGGDSSRAYLASCDGGGVNIIDTFTDTFIVNLHAPIGARAPIPPSPLNPPQSPVFLIAGP